MKRNITKRNLTEFVQLLHKEEHSDSTIQKYTHDLRAFAAWLGDGGVTKEAVVDWKKHLVEQGFAPVTVNSKLSALNTFLRCMGWADCRVKFLRIQRQLFRDRSKELTREEYDRLLAAARKRGDSRLELLMETICATGIRVSEVRYITVEAARAGYTEIHLKGKIRAILLPDKLCRKLLRYAKKQKTTSGEIFLTGSGSSLSRRQIWAEMKRLCEYAKIQPSKVFPHNLRHLFAVTFYRSCQDIVKLADVLGHSSIETTRIYLVSSWREHARQLEQLCLVC